MVYQILKCFMARNRGQSAADVADATRAAFHRTAPAHPTEIVMLKDVGNYF